MSRPRCSWHKRATTKTSAVQCQVPESSFRRLGAAQQMWCNLTTAIAFHLPGDAALFLRLRVARVLARTHANRCQAAP